MNYDAYSSSNTWCLLESIESFVELEHSLLFFLFHIALWLSDIDLLLDFTIQEGQFHI